MSLNEIENQTKLKIKRLNPEDQAILETYLESKAITGSKNKQTIQSVLNRFLKVLQVTSLRDITRAKILAFFDYLQKYPQGEQDNEKKTPYSYSYKKMFRQLINSFFLYYTELIVDVDPFYRNPMPIKTLKMVKPMQTPQEEAKELEESVYTIDQLWIILKRTRDITRGSLWLSTRSIFPIICLLICCGMRISECLTIRLENLHLNDRYLITGLEENARKNKRPLSFCFPKELIPILEAYLEDRNNHMMNSSWVFPSQQVSLVEHFLLHHFPKPILSIAAYPHAFRRTLSTLRINGLSKTPLYIEETLSNHTISSQIMKSYDKYALVYRLADYDQYFPKEYRPLLEYLQSL